MAQSYTTHEYHPTDPNNIRSHDNTTTSHHHSIISWPNWDLSILTRILRVLWNMANEFEIITIYYFIGSSSIAFLNPRVSVGSNSMLIRHIYLYRATGLTLSVAGSVSIKRRKVCGGTIDTLIINLRSDPASSSHQATKIAPQQENEREWLSECFYMYNIR